jgi:hypothetical protein
MALEFVREDESVEATPGMVRLRQNISSAHELGAEPELCPGYMASGIQLLLFGEEPGPVRDSASSWPRRHENEEPAKSSGFKSSIPSGAPGLGLDLARQLQPDLIPHDLDLSDMPGRS